MPEAVAATHTTGTLNGSAHHEAVAPERPAVRAATMSWPMGCAVSATTACQLPTAASWCQAAGSSTGASGGALHSRVSVRTCQCAPPRAGSLLAAAWTWRLLSGWCGGIEARPPPGSGVHSGQGEARRCARSRTTLDPDCARAAARRPATVDRPLPPTAERTGVMTRAWEDSTTAG